MAIMSYLGLIMDKVLERYSRLSPWIIQREMGYTFFAQQNIDKMWDYAEVAPVIIWENSIRSVLEGLMAALANDRKCDVQRASATNLPYEDEMFDVICTDPPYYDSMQYSHLSDFFYVWLKRALGHLHPELFRGTHTPKKSEVVETEGKASHVSLNCITRDSDGYRALMSESLKKMYCVLKPDGILVLVYAHKTTKGWETLIESILDAGFTITAAWPVDTEQKTRMGSRVGGQGTASLASSIYMVGRKWDREPTAEWRTVRPCTARTRM